MNNHHFLSADEGVQCLRCGGYWADNREDDAAPCVGPETDFNTVHGCGTLNEQGHDIDCVEFADSETDDCRHTAYNRGCNCDYCEFM